MQLIRDNLTVSIILGMLVNGCFNDIFTKNHNKVMVQVVVIKIYNINGICC